MDLISLANRLYRAALFIDAGRKGFATRGKEQEGRISYEDGIAEAMSAFQEASNHDLAKPVDSLSLILAEYTFITQEFQLCDKADKDTINSLTKAIESFDDAFLALQVVEDKTAYVSAEKTYPRKKDYRVSGYPKDSFHIACIGHKTRLKNILKTPGLDSIEKALLKQRLSNLAAAQGLYVKKQRKALANEK